MNKQAASMALTILIAFLILVAVAIIVLVGFSGGWTNLMGWVNDQITSLRSSGVIGASEEAKIIEKAKNTEILTTVEQAKLKGASLEVYTTWLFYRGREDYDLKKYDVSKKLFKEFVEGCATNLKNYCLPKDEEKAKEYLVKIDKIETAFDEFESIQREVDPQNRIELQQRRDAVDSFLKKYEGMKELEEEYRSVKEISVEVDTALLKLGRKEEEAIKKDETKPPRTFKDYVQDLGLAERSRKTGTRESIREAKDAIQDIITSGQGDNQLMAEAYLLKLLITSDEGSCYELDGLIEQVKSYGENLNSFKYLHYTYPQDSVFVEPNLLGINWISSPIYNEALSAKGWCKFKTGDLSGAYFVAKELGEADAIKNFDGKSKGGLKSTGGSSRYKLFRSSAFELIDAEETCEEIRDEIYANRLDCHKNEIFAIVHSEEVEWEWKEILTLGLYEGAILDSKDDLLKLPEAKRYGVLYENDFDKKTEWIKFAKGEVTTEDVAKHPNIGCWWSYTAGAECESCELKDITTCQDYETGEWYWGGDDWELTCKDNPCGINLPKGCYLDTSWENDCEPR